MPFSAFALDNRFYGYRRVTYALRAQGWQINHKRVARLMRLDHWLAIGRRRFVVVTNSKHDLEIAINVALRLTPTEVDQLWVADITSMRLGRVDAFLAVATDAFPRKIIGWNVGPSLATELPLERCARREDAKAGRNSLLAVQRHRQPASQYQPLLN